MALISEEWMQLKPNEELDGSKEDLDLYFQRIQKKRNLKHIPREVLDQWIYKHHNDDYTLKNYAWINYEEVKIRLVEWPINTILKVNVIESFQNYVVEKSKHTNISQFCCNDKDADYWKEYGTWRIPPIILDVNSLKSEIPSWSDISAPYQLVEGHTRFGYLHAMKKITEYKNGEVAKNHKLFLMCYASHE